MLNLKEIKTSLLLTVTLHFNLFLLASRILLPPVKHEAPCFFQFKASTMRFFLDLKQELYGS
jgi:hypothetical protein